MMKEETKMLIDQSVDIIVSCWDENNPDDGKSFDERLEEKIMSEENSQIRQILMKAKS